MKKQGKAEHCCGQMARYICDPRINVHYCSKYREYAIYLQDSPAKQCLFYCPWCGKKLPEDLRGEYFRVLDEEYKIDDPRDVEQSRLIPEEFKSDKWWKKRGL